MRRNDPTEVRTSSRLSAKTLGWTILLVGLFVAGMAFFQPGVQSDSPEVLWWNATWDYRTPAKITTGNYGSEDVPISWNADLVAKLAAMQPGPGGDTDPFDPTSVRVIEYNPDGTVLGEVPSQFTSTPALGAGIAVIQFSDSYTSTIVGPALTALGYSFTDVTADLEAGTLDYQSYSFVLIDTFATVRVEIHDALNADAGKIQTFVASGGVMMMMAQANQDLNDGAGLAPPGAVDWAPLTMKYGDPDGDVYRVDTLHDLWNTPNIVDPNGMGGNPCWEGLTQWDPAYTIHAYRCSGGTVCTAPDTTLAAFAELPWFGGAFLFTAIPADVRYASGTAPEQAVALDQLENMVEYGLSLVGSGTPPAPELLWMLDGVTAPNTDRHFYVYFDSWDGVDPITQKGDPVYVTDLSATGTIIENEHFLFDVGGFSDWTVKDIGAGAPEVWGPPGIVWALSDYLIFGAPGGDVPPVTAALLEAGPVRSKVLLSPSQGSVMEMTFYTGAPYYERTILTLPVDPCAIGLNDERPAGNIQPMAEASGVAPAPFSVDKPSETDFQCDGGDHPLPTAVPGTAHAWIGVYDTADQAGYAEVAAMADIVNWGMEQGGPMSVNEYDATRLPVSTWSYYFQYGTTVPPVMDLATQRFANPPALAEEDLVPTLVDAGSDLTVDEGETINFSGFVSPDVENPTYDWTFGDTNTAGGTLTPTHAYDEQGLYTVALTVGSSSHGALGDSLQVTVLNVAPLVNAGSDQVVLDGVEVQFNCSFSDPGVLDTHTFEWEFGDGDTDSATLTPAHTYSLPGIFTARCTVTDDDGDVGFAEVTIDVVEPSATALLDDGPAGTGSLVQGAAGDITLRNQLLAVTVAKVTVNTQLVPTGFGHVLDGAPIGLIDGLDWVMVGYIEPTHTENGTAWDIQTVDYTTVAITDPGTSHAQVTAGGVYTDNTGVTLSTTYDLDPLDKYVTITTVLTNTTGSAVDFWFGDVMDFDGTPSPDQTAYIPGVGSTSDATTISGQPLERWMAQWGTGPEAYALHYEAPVLIYGPNSWIKSAWPFHLEPTGDPEDSATFVRHLIITDSSGFADHVEAIEDVVSIFPAPVPASPTFTVTDSVSGALLEGAVVSLESAFGGSTTGFTDINGEVTIDVIAGDYTMRASRPGYFASTPQVLTLPEGGSAWAVQLDQRPDAGIEYVILVVSDGMSWDVLNAQAPTEIMDMITDGAAATHGISEVPSATAVNMRTFDTGAHASSHGVVGNAYVNTQSESLDTLNAAVGRAGMTFENLSSPSAIITKINNGTLTNYTRWWWGTTDFNGHHYGPDSPQYAAAIQTMSTSIGQIMAALESSTSGIDTGNTVLGLGSDHGMQPLVPFGTTAPDPSCLDATPWDCRVIDARYVLEQAGIVVDTWRASGPRMAHVYLNNPADGPAAKAALEARTGVHHVFLRAELDGTDLSAITPDVVAYLNHPNSGDVIAFVEREYSMGRSVLQLPADPVGSGRNYYWDCDDDYMGGHGGITAQDEYIPFVLWGDAIDPGCNLGARPNADWAPTITALLGIDPPFDADGSAAMDCLRCTDDDGDGFNSCGGDCDDADPDIFPGALELCDGVDNNCSGEIDNGSTGTVFSMPDDAAGGPGDTVLIPIIVTPANGIAVDLVIEFDPLVLQLADVLKTPISDPAGDQDFLLTYTPDNINGVLLISLFGANPPMTGTGPLLDLEFTVIGAAGQSSPLDFTSAEINEGQIESCVDHGLFTGCDNVDDDGDGFSECDGDCDDNDINNWDSCGTCVDGDTDTYYDGCDDYVTISGPDCDDVDPFINPGETDDDCDDVDEDCSGVADDGYVSDESCFLPGACAAGNVGSSCNAGVETVCVTGSPTGISEAVCNGVDDDCDDSIDEDYVIDDTCFLPGACAAGNVGSSCDTGVETTCATGSPTGISEAVCNGVDDDCDDSIDEDYVIDDTCFLPGACAAGNVASSCDTGVETTCATGSPTGISEAVCNGVDDDCDDSIDEDYVIDDTCFLPGACAAGNVASSCDTGVETTCATGSPTGISEAVCNGVDDDCDDSIDEDYVVDDTCFLPGACAAGNVASSCDTGVETTCATGSPTGISEAVCNGVDDDCDDTIDEDYVVDDTCFLPGACAAGNVASSCDTGVETTCATGSPTGISEAVCNGVDDDCDDSIDEDYVIDDTCFLPGACAAGNVASSCDTGVETTCATGSPTGISEAVCNGADDDCDDSIDEDYVIDDTCFLPGACAAGNVASSCDTGVETTCATGSPTGISETVCNGVDDDCDDSIDEDYVIDDTCFLPGACAAGNVASSCDTGVETTCATGSPTGISETVCNGVDDDCDDSIDEDYVIDDTCFLPGACAAGNVASSCDTGVETTCATGSPTGISEAVCNGADDDCDAATDEDYVIDNTCFLPGACAAGNVASSCDTGVETTCATGSPTGISEAVCNGVDDDCDAATDEDYVVDDTCFLPGACAAGNLASSCDTGLETTCATGSPTGISEAVCNGVDDDCDDSIDEDYVVDDTCFLPGACAAGNVASSCDTGVEATCATGSPTGISEAVCNGVDDDCDDSIDEDYVVDDTCFLPGACAAGNVASSCDTGVETTCATGSPTGISETVCNGVDDDCDDSLDEDYVIDDTCFLPGACAAGNLASSCDTGVETTCATGSPTGISETVCNGADDDCDAATDEDYVIDDTCFLPGACAAGNVASSCDTGVETTCATGSPTGISEAVCNGADDDCDAATDEDYVIDNTCFLPGACAAGNVASSCDAGVETTCATGSPTGISEAVCNGVDDDCDAATDEDYVIDDTCFLPGACAAGNLASSCDTGVETTCATGSPTGISEAVCNGVDDDCDDSIDEDYVIDDTCFLPGACAAGNVASSCDTGVETTCATGSPTGISEAVCNGVDDDCDDSIDEDYVIDDTCFLPGACAAGNVASSCDTGVETTCATGSPTGISEAVCNGVDDDCDDTIDEDYVVDDTCFLPGACAAGNVASSCDTGVETTCATGSPTGISETVCNGVDDDCDDSIDEDYVIDDTCFLPGACAAGNVASSCDTGVETTCATGSPTGISEAVCNGVDDDCDAATDEDYVIDNTCFLPGACAAGNVASSCDTGVETTCATGSPTGISEAVCNGVDDDCDAATDEDYVVDDTCFLPGACAAGNLASSCDTGLETTCATGSPTGISEAVCNGVDDDCDDSIDEDYVVDDTCFLPGACAAGNVASSCDTGVETTCATGSPTGISEAVCNGVDDDCDDSIDEDYVIDDTCFLPGACAAGNVASSCDTGVETTCATGSPTGISETVCNGVDDDCDDSLDEDYVVDDTCFLPGACAAGNVASSCDTGVETTCATGSPTGISETVCNGVDDDCDDSLDEDYVIDDTCFLPGACAAGNVASSCDTGVETTCATGSPTGISETVCNGVDDDCDDSIDEDYVIDDTCFLPGACAAGNVASSCDTGVETTCATGSPTGISETVCNGADDDCNDSIDEDYVIDNTCFLPGVCAAGNVASSCDTGVETTCATGSPTGISEAVCNGVDDDCDAATDEDYVVDDTCFLPGACAAGNLASSCDTGLETTCATGSPTGISEAVCNGVDDDCDDSIDEDYVVDDTCFLPGACAAGNVASSCDTGVETTCATGSPTGISETVCNGVDDDCDDSIDEDYVVDDTCFLPGACAAGNVASSCDTGVETTCATGSPTGISEAICNGVDDDCDDTIDEDYVVDDTCFLPGACAAGNVASSCDTGVETTCVPGTPEAEVCDGLDNNCDGDTDENGAALCDDGSVCTTDTCNAFNAAGISFDGTDDFVDLGNDSSIADYGTGSFTIEGWVNARTTTSLFDGIYRHGRQGAFPQVAVEFHDGAKLRFSVESNDGDNVVTPDQPVTLNVWHHFAAVVDRGASQILLYVDGGTPATVATPWGALVEISSTDNLMLGAARDPDGLPTDYLDGLIDEIRVWDHVRTQGEIVADMNSAIISAPGLIARYGLNEGSGTTTTDSVGSLVGALTNGPAWETSNIPLLDGGQCDSVPIFGCCEFDLDCDDGDPCTDDVCSVVGGGCDYTGICGISGTVYYYRDDGTVSEPSIKTVPNVEIDATSDGIAEQITDGGGIYAIPDLYGSYVVTTLDKYGDPRISDINGGVTSFDSSLIAQAVVQQVTLSTHQELAADVTGSGQVTSFDAARIAQYAVSQIDHFDVAMASGSDWLFYSCDRYDGASDHDCVAPVYTHDPLDESVSDDFYAILYGDVTGNWQAAAVPPGRSTTTGGEAEARERDQRQAAALRANPVLVGPRPDELGSARLWMSGPTGVIPAGKQWTATLNLNDADGITALDLSLEYDADRVSILGVAKVDLASGLVLTGNDLGKRYLVSLFGVLPMEGSGAIVTITLQAREDIKAMDALSITAEANEGRIKLKVGTDLEIARPVLKDVEVQARR